MTLAREIHVSPWEALLMGVRIAAGAVRETEQRLQDFENQTLGATGVDSPITPALVYWREQSQRERQILQRTTEAAIKVGLAERLTAQSTLVGSVIVTALTGALDAIPELTQDQRNEALAAAQSRLATTDGMMNSDT